MFRIVLASALTILVAGAAWAGGTCDKEKAAAASASAGHCGAEKASVKMAGSGGQCTAAEKAACAAKKSAMAANEDCVYCGFVATLKENEGKVTMITEDTDKGVRVVFAALSKDNVKAAQAIADKAYVMMAGPNHCAVTKAKMAAGSCGDCKSGLDAFAETEVTIEKNDTGATTLVKVQKKEQLEKLHAFFAGLKPAETTKTQG